MILNICFHDSEAQRKLENMNYNGVRRYMLYIYYTGYGVCLFFGASEKAKYGRKEKSFADSETGEIGKIKYVYHRWDGNCPGN